MSSHHHNPERNSWKGRSYRKGGENIQALRDAAFRESDRLDTLEPGPYAAPALPVDPDDNLPF